MYFYVKDPVGKSPPKYMSRKQSSSEVRAHGSTLAHERNMKNGYDLKVVYNTKSDGFGHELPH